MNAWDQNNWQPLCKSVMTGRQGEKNRYVMHYYLMIETQSDSSKNNTIIYINKNICYYITPKWNALDLSFDDGKIHPIDYEETDSYQITKLFIENKEQLLERLFRTD